MNLLDSLLDAIVRLDGDALVMHVGEKPYVVTTSEATNQFRGPLAWGQVELSTRVLTTDAVTGMLGQIMPPDQRSALDEFGATDYDVTSAAHPEERFSIVAARGGDDIWVEMRRHPKTPAVEAMPSPPEQAVAAAETGSIERSAEEAAPIGSTPGPEPPPAVEEDARVETSETPRADVKPGPVPVAIAAEPAHEEVGEPAPVEYVEDVLVDAEPDAEIELPFTIEVSPDREEELAQAAELPVADLPALESGNGEDSVELDVALSDFSGLEFDLAQELDLDQELDPRTFSLDADVEAGILAATQEWGDDVMTEGELGELLRATAAAVISGETLHIKSSLDIETHGPVAVAERETTEPGIAEPEVAPHDAVEPEVAELEVAELEVAEFAVAELEEVTAPAAPAFAEEPVVSAEDQLPAAASVPEPLLLVEPSAETPPSVAFATDVPRENGVSRETRELPVLVEYQLERDRAAVSAFEAAASEERSVSSTEGVWPVSEDVTLEGFNTSTRAEDEEAAPSRPAAVVLPLTRQTKGESGDSRAAAATNLQRLLRLAANRGAATVYVVANTAPLVRVDGEFSTLEGEPAISTAIVERLLGEVSPAGGESAPPSAEWLIDVPEIGRVRCLTFRDHRGPGIIFRMVPARAIAADQLGLSAEVQALCSEADGVVLVTGGRDSGRSTLLTSFVDLINRTSADHIITIESQIDFVHESKRSFISQREVRGEDAMVGAVRSACREEPDVLVIEDIRSYEVAALALEAADAGCLVFASVPGLSTSSAVERLIELFPADRREKAQASLAGNLRGVVSQVLLKKLRGGRVAAREVLLNTPAVAGLIMEGKTFQLSTAIENGRRAGMMSFAESLSALVREGVVHPSHACRKAPSREQLIAALHRDGVDTSIAERLG